MTDNRSEGKRTRQAHKCSLTYTLISINTTLPSTPILLSVRQQRACARSWLQGTSVADSRATVEMARRFDSVVAGVGIHPDKINSAVGQDELDELETLAQLPRGRGDE